MVKQLKKSGLGMVVLLSISGATLAQDVGALTSENATLWPLIKTGGVTMIPLGLWT